MSNNNIKKLKDLISSSEYVFLKQLDYWSSKSIYGVTKHDRRWIYNTLEQWAEQLGVSKSTVRRAIAYLKAREFIDSQYLSPVKRDRTLYYSINYEKINDFIREHMTQFHPPKILSTTNIKRTITASPYAHVNNINEHLDEHMYIKNQLQNNKSNKSIKKIKKQDCSNLIKILQDSNKIPKQKPTIVQDMLRIWQEEFYNLPVILSKRLARFIVAAFKSKFDSCLEKWRKYLKTLKTSAFIMSNKFKLNIWWVIKYTTIDQIREGWLGTDEKKIPVNTSEIYKETISHIENVPESQKCKTFRTKIAKTLSPEIYISWFKSVKMYDFPEGIVIETPNNFITDSISTHFLRNFEKDIFKIVTSPIMNKSLT